MDIANFLMQNGIQYIYEQPYEIDTRTSEYGQYYPDFYLPDYKIYIEYFGIVKYTQKYIKLTKMNLKVYNWYLQQILQAVLRPCQGEADPRGWF